MRPTISVIAATIPAIHCAAIAAPAATPAGELPIIAMQHSSWTAAEGAPTGIKGIAQTPDGWLWIGSTAGLFRFDGVRFERAPAALAPLSSTISSLGVLADGTLWMSYKFGGASLVRGGRVRHFRVGEHRTPGGTVNSIGQDARGRVWLGSGQGLRVLGADGNWQRPDAGMGAPEGGADAMLLDRRGGFWVRTGDAVHVLRKDGARFESKLAVKGHGTLAEHPDGSIWTSDMMGNGLYLVDGEPQAGPDAWRTEDGINDFSFDRAGSMWQPTTSGVKLTAPSGATRQQHSDMAHGLSGHHGFTVFQDREGNVWIGTENGLDRFRPYRLGAIALPAYIGGARPLAARPAGGVWIDRSFLAEPGAQPLQFAPKGSDLDLTTALHADADGTLWSGGIGGLWKIRDGRREAVPLPSGVPDPMRTAIFSMAGGADGRLWISMGRRGLYALRGGEWEAHGGIAALDKFAATAMAGDARGRMWFGSTDDRLAILEQGRVRRLGREDGLGLGTVLAILPAADGAWVGGENGLAWFDGKRFIPVTGQGGDPFAGTTGIVFALDGSLWLNGGAGISAIGADELRKTLERPGYRVRFERLDYRDGLPGTASGITPLPSAIRSADGKLWFSTLAGTVGFDPAALQRNSLPPPVYVTGLKADGKDYPVRDGVALAAGTGRVEIDFTALSYRSPERMRFRYRLEGVDQAWQEPENRRAAYYTNLAPGSYRFRVAASNDDGVWNEQGALLRFELAPSLTQAGWFRMLCGGAVLAGLWLLHRMRLRRAGRRLAAQMNARLAERERIARELHDTLLQSIQGLLWKMRAAARRLGEDDRKPIDEALETAGQVLADGRDRVAGLRGESVMQAGLAAAIRTYGEPLARQAQAGFDVLARGKEAVLDGAVCDAVFAIAREAIWNAFVHARPRKVMVTLAYGRRELVVTIADDGAGMPAEVLLSGARPGHWGIPGMRERAAKIGALELVSNEGQGTTWTLRVPLGGA